MMVENKYPLPYLDYLFYQLKENKSFSKISSTLRYHQVRIKYYDIYNLKFKTRYGHYEFIVVSFGLTNTPKAFICFMNNIFRE